MISIFPIDINFLPSSDTNISESILSSLEKYFPLVQNDILVISSTLISIVHDNFIKFENEFDKISIIENESKRIIRKRKDKLITQTNQGLICTNAGSEELISKPGYLLLLPKDADKQANSIRLALKNKTGIDVGIIISTCIDKPFRYGKEAIALGFSGLKAIDTANNDFAIADTLANSAQLVLENTEQIYFALIRTTTDKFKGNSKSNDLVKADLENLFY